MNKLIFAGLLALIANHCTSATSPLPVSPGFNKISITHFNITFASDLSNRVNPRLYKRPLNDVELLKIVTDNLYPSILRYRRSESQKDKLLVDFINKGLISEYQVHTERLWIDFGRFDRQYDRIAYILERNVKQTLRKDVDKMINEFNRINSVAARQNFGADIWTYMNEGLDNKRVLPDEKPISDQTNSYVNTYRNVLIIVTDGYIEAGIYEKGFDLSKTRIDNFRTAYLASGQHNLKDFFKKNKQFRITPVHNEYLKNMEVLVMELYDRSKSKGGAATIQPTDMEIIKLFWTDWLQQSKVKRFELHPYANSKDEAEKIILTFLGVNKQ